MNYNLLKYGDSTYGIAICRLYPSYCTWMMSFLPHVGPAMMFISQTRNMTPGEGT